MLSKTVAKKSVNLIMPKLHNIVFTLTLIDDNGPGFVKDFNIEFHTGDNVANKTAKVIEMMQEAIDNYKAERQIYDSTALNNAVNTINGGLTL